MELSRAFKWFAFEGGTGDDRWKNAGADFRHDLTTLSQARTCYALDKLLLLQFGSVVVHAI